MIVMKPRTGAAAAANAVAVLRSSATNQDGRSSSLTAPNGPSQSALIGSAATLAGKPSVPHCQEYSTAGVFDGKMRA